MKTFFRAAALGVLLAAGAGTLRADDALKQVQQSLRDQGFYYGPIDGSPGDETTQALRRYQIRNGLPVNGQLDDETKRSIAKTGREVASTGGGGSGGTRPTVRPAPSPGTGGGSTGNARRMITGEAAGTPRPSPSANYQRPTVRSVPEESRREVTRNDEGGTEEVEAPLARGGRSNSTTNGNLYARPDLRAAPDTGGFGDRPEPGGAMPRNAVLPSARLSALFASTPFEFAPPPVQSDVLRRAQGILRRQGFYDESINGVPGSSIEEAVEDYQGVNHLRKTGRLDVSTLGNMRLLPGRQRIAPRERRGGYEDDDDDRGPRGGGIIFEGRVVE